GSRHHQRTAKLGHRAGRRLRGLLRLDERELHPFSFAKKAAAFFSISRSTRSSRTSLRSFASSSFSSLVSVPRLLLPASARACSTQWPNADGVRSRSRAASAIVLPFSSTRLTAPALNSSVKLRRLRFGFFVDSSVIGDTVSASHLVSTELDQAQSLRRQ